tara:strand:+ start:4782 stop:7679 length:2898 start_codon:yes stop_codon:yes gene_type:complete
MNQLTKYLVNGILNEGEEEVVALYGGGFKPPTGGHFEVVKTALQQNPEITNLKILVGSKERDGVDQAEAILVWDIYSKYLPMKVEILPSKKPPIGEIYSYSKANPNQSIYWVIGARKDNEDDFKDIEGRSKGMEKYPNMVLKPIVTSNKGMSGTNARLALKTRNVEEFKKYLPSELSKDDIEEIFQILSPSVEENITLNEGRYDTISNRISSDIFNNWKSNISNGLIKFNNTYVFEDDEIEIEATLKLSPNSDKFKVDGGAYNEEDSISVEFEIDPEWLPDYWKEISMNLKDVIRHEIEHLTHGGGFQEKPGKYMEDDSMLRVMIDKKLLPKSDYFKLEKEIDANLQGMYFRAKKEKKPLRDVIDDYLNSQNLTSEEKEEIINIWNKRTKALSLPSINENATYSKNIDYKQQIKDLTKYMLNQKMNIIPLPKVIFKHGNQDNAENFFGKTAYYDPNSKTIVLFTEGRHPKDIVRSFAHEMIHHIQNLEGRLEGITTTNTQEDDHLTSIEAEAYQDGNLSFRGYTDTILNENIFKKSLDQTEKEALEIVDKNWDKFGGKECNKGFCDIFAKNLSKHLPGSKIMSTEDPRNETLGHVWVEYKGKYFDAETPNGVPSWEELPWMEEFHSKVGNYPSDIERLNEAKQVGLLYHVTTPQKLEKILNSNTLRGSYISWDGGETDFLGISTTRNKNFLYDNNKIQIVLDGDKISNNYKVMPYDYWRRNYNIPGESQTQDEDEEIIKVGEGGLKSIKDYIIKINDFTENINETKKSKDPFGLNQYARELAKGLEEELEKTRIPEEEVVSSPKDKDMEYIIYSDMDGVITDFEGRFKKFSNGISPSEYQNKNGVKKFWDLIDVQTGVKFWVGMPWMEDGKEYWDYISKYKPTLLSSPSINNESRLGKRLWVKNNLPGTPLKLAYSRNKKNYAQENAILIDDRENNINQWKANGGIGILHTSASDTIRQLKELGL